MPTVKAKFGVDEKVLCFHGPLLYEAKVLKDARIEKQGPNANQPQYFIHYNGWRKSWDEWVPETRVLKHNEENLKKQKQLKQSAAGSKDKKRKLEATKEADSTSKSSDKKRKSRHQPVEHVQVDDEFKTKPEVKIPVPDDLKRQLVDDWDFITRQKKLVGLPRTPSVRTIITQYLQDRNLKGRNLELAKEVTSGLITYFEHCLGTILLYRFERAQYVDVLSKIQETNTTGDASDEAIAGEGENGDQDVKTEKKENTSLAGKKVSEIYGAEHLLRLFVKLPMVLAHTDLEEDNCKVLVDSFQDILKFMSRNAPDLFLQEYENVTAAHIRISS